MLTREQGYAMRLMRHRAGTLFSDLPLELIQEIYFSLNGQDPNSEINQALRLAVAREENPEEKKFNLTILKKMLDANPRLVLEAGNVTTRCGLPLTRTTLLRYAVYSLDPKLVEIVKPYYDHPSIVGGAALREQELAICRPHVEALAREIELYIEQGVVTYDVSPLFDMTQQANPADVTALLNKNMQHPSTLRDEYNGLRQVIKPRTRTEGMHDRLLPTFMQALDLLAERWEDLTVGFTNYNRVNLIWCQLIGGLEDALSSTVVRMALARGCQDTKETLQFIWQPTSSYPDSSRTSSVVVPGEVHLSGLGFDNAIFGRGWIRWVHIFLHFGGDALTARDVSKILSSTVFRLAELMQQSRPKQTSQDVIQRSNVGRLRKQ